MKVVVIYSGGLDSTVLLYHLRAEGHQVRALSVDYGQRHARELRSAAEVCRLAGVEQRVVALPGLGELFSSAAGGRGQGLLDATASLPEGAYGPDNLPATTVPNRNLILVAVAAGWAWLLGFEAVAFAAHAGTALTYPDCRPEFVRAAAQACRLGNDPPVDVLAPFVTWLKADIVRRGQELGVPLGLTWSCYRGGEKHCGRCTTCDDRRKAFRAAGVADPTEYEA